MALQDPKDIEVANLAAKQAEEIDDKFDNELDLEPERAPRKAQTVPNAEQPSQPSQKQQHTRGNIRRALAFGATQQQIDATHPDDLDDWIEVQNNALALERERNSRPTPNTKQQAPPPEEDEVDWGLHESGRPLTEEDFQPGMAKFIKSQHKENRELKKTVASLAARETKKREQELHDAYDTFFENASPKLYGQGQGSTMLQSTKEMKRRNHIIQLAEVDPEKDSPAVIARKLKAAHQEEYGKVVEEPEEPEETTGYQTVAPLNGLVPRGPNGKPRITQKQLEDSALAVPTARGKKPVKGRSAAEKAVSRQMREHGHTEDDYSFEEEGLPE